MASATEWAVGFKTVCSVCWNGLLLHRVASFLRNGIFSKGLFYIEGTENGNGCRQTIQCLGNLLFHLFLPEQLTLQNDRDAARGRLSTTTLSLCLCPSRCGQQRECRGQRCCYHDVLATRLTWYLFSNVLDLPTFAELAPILGLCQNLSWECQLQRTKQSG